MINLFLKYCFSIYLTFINCIQFCSKSIKEISEIFILITFFLYGQVSFSQSFTNDSSVSSSLINEELSEDDSLQFKNIFRSDLKTRISQDDFLGLSLFKNAINDSSLYNIKNKLELYDYPKDRTAYFHDSFQLLLQLEKKQQGKYDLGELSRYLGISRDVLAVILVIISAVK